MLIAGFLRRLYKAKFKLPKTDLEELLVVFKDCDYLIVIKDPDFFYQKYSNHYLRIFSKQK